MSMISDYGISNVTIEPRLIYQNRAYLIYIVWTINSLDLVTRNLNDLSQKYISSLLKAQLPGPCQKPPSIKLQHTNSSHKYRFTTFLQTSCLLLYYLLEFILRYYGIRGMIAPEYFYYTLL